MRFLRYGDDGHGLTLDFHEDVTILAALRPIEEARVVRALRAAIMGRAVDAPLQVEIDGEVVQLAAGDRIPETNHHPMDCVGQADQIAEFAAQTDSAVAAGRHRLKAADRAVLVLEESVAATRAQHDQLAAERSRLEHEVEVVGLRAEAMRAETDEIRIRSMARTQIDHLRSHVEYLRDLPVTELVRLADELRMASGPGPVPDQRAQSLADHWADVAARAAALEESLVDEGRSPEEFAARMEAAQRAIGAEEAPFRPGAIDGEIAELVEAAHEEVIESEAKRRRFLGSKSARRIEEAHAKERELLGQLGFTTWTGYVMGTVGMDTGDRAERLQVAQEELAAVQAEWDEVSAELAENPAYSALFEEMEVLYAEAVELIGGDPSGDIEETLRSITVEQDPSADPDALAFQVVGALRRVGVTIDDGLTHEEVSEQAGHVIDSLADGAAVADEQAELADRLERLLEAVENEGAAVDDLAQELGDELSTDVAALELRADEITSEIVAIDTRIAEVDDLISARLTLRDTAVAATRRTAVDLIDTVAEAGSLPEAAQNEYLAHRLRNHLDEEDVPPLILDHAFAGFVDLSEPLGLLEAEQGAIQIIVITARADLSDWAGELGATNAVVITR